MRRCPFFTQLLLRILVLMVFVYAPAARADAIQLDLSNLVNSDLTAYSGGNNYPQHGGMLTVDGISFLLSKGKNSDTAVIQTPTDSGDSQTFAIPVGIFGVTSVDTLINSAFGSCGTNVGQIEFVGSTTTFTETLTEGSNVRDHFNGNFCNSAINVSGTASFGVGGQDRLDLQQFALPAAFASQKLESIEFIGLGQGRSGSPFLATATVFTAPSAEIPEPNLLPFAALGLAFTIVRRLRG